jgi:hypothetical protein
MELALAAVTIVLAAPQEAAPARVHRVHDVAAIRGARSVEPLALDLCPVADEMVREHDDHSCWLDLDRFADGFRALLVNGGAKELGEVTVWGNGAVELTASTAVHDEVARLIDGLDAAILGEERLEVRVLLLRPGEEDLALALLLPETEAERRERQIVAAGRAKLCRVLTSALPDSIVTEARAESTGLAVTGFQVEICHGSAIHDPVIGVDKVGLTATVRAARLAGATLLDLALREIEAVAPPRERVVEPKAWFTSPEPHEGSVADATRDDLSAATFDGKVPLRIESPLRGVASFAGSLVVPNGSVLWIPTRVVTTAGPVAFVLEIRVQGPWRPALQQFEIDAEQKHTVSIVHLGALQSEGFTWPPYDRRTFASQPLERNPPTDPKDKAFDAWWPSLAEAKQPAADPFGIVASLTRRLAGRPGFLVAPLSARHLAIASPSERKEEVARAVNEALAPPPTFELSGRVLRGDALLAEFRIPAVTGRLATLWSGIATSRLFGWSADVAEQSQVSGPVMSSLFDGFALTFEVRAATGSRTRLAVNGVLCFLDEAPKSESLGSPYTPSVEKLRARRLLLDDEQSFDPAAPAAPLRFGGSSLALEVTVTAVGK